jgi:hypothetical protein
VALPGRLGSGDRLNHRPPLGSSAPDASGTPRRPRSLPCVVRGGLSFSRLSRASTPASAVSLAGAPKALQASVHGFPERTGGQVGSGFQDRRTRPLCEPSKPTEATVLLVPVRPSSWTVPSRRSEPAWAAGHAATPPRSGETIASKCGPERGSRRPRQRGDLVDAETYRRRRAYFGGSDRT